jgi:hypothetical protein
MAATHGLIKYKLRRDSSTARRCIENSFTVEVAILPPTTKEKISNRSIYNALLGDLHSFFSTTVPVGLASDEGWNNTFA